MDALSVRTEIRNNQPTRVWFVSLKQAARRMLLYPMLAARARPRTIRRAR